MPICARCSTGMPGPQGGRKGEAMTPEQAIRLCAGQGNGARETEMTRAGASSMVVSTEATW